MIFVLDVDGVLADFIHGFTRLANDMFGTPVYSTLQQLTWDNFDGLDKKQISSVWEVIKKSNFFWSSLPPMATKNEFQLLNGLAEQNDVYFATSRPGIRAKYQTEAWLETNGIWNPTVIVTSDKGETAKVVKADALLDDKAGNVIFTQYHSPKTVPYIIDRQYNSFDGAVVGSKVVRVKTVLEFLEKAWINVPLTHV